MVRKPPCINRVAHSVDVYYTDDRCSLWC